MKVKEKQAMTTPTDQTTQVEPLSEGHEIVARIWELFGSPTYEELEGRSIYDVIEAMQATISAQAKKIEELEAERDRLRERWETWHSNNRDLWDALNLIRAEVEEHGPISSGEYTAPTPQTEAELIVKAIAAIAEKAEADRDQLRETLIEIRSYFDDRADVQIDHQGPPNEEMCLLTQIDAALTS